MLRKKTNGVARRSQRTSILSEVANKSVDRRDFLRGSGLAIGGLTAIAATGGAVTQAAAASAANQSVETIKSVCTHCSVGCTVVAEVQDGVWTGQEPGWDSPFQFGRTLCQGRCCKRACPRRKKTQISYEKRGWRVD